MKLPLAYYGDAVLRKKALPVKEIDASIHQLVKDMEETMTFHKGCGLAAPQVHRSIALFLTQIPRYVGEKEVDPGIVRAFLNPKILSYSQESWGCSEACLSIPGMREMVIRPLKILLEATTLEGTLFTEEFVGFDAHVIMHENDHLNGVLYIDRLPQDKRKRLEPQLRALKKEHA